MGYFAKLNNNSIVEQVIAIDNDVLGEPTIEFPETEGAGKAFIVNTLKLPGEFKQTSYNNNFRYHYAGIGYTFDPNIGEHGAFIPPQPFASWTLDDNMNWQPPIAYPNDGLVYNWDENSQKWVLIYD